MPFHLFRSSSVSFISSMYFFSACMSCTCYVRFIPKYFTFFINCKWHCVLNFGVHVFIASMKKYSLFLFVSFVPGTLLNSFIWYKRGFIFVFGIFLGALLYRQLYHLQKRIVLSSFPVCMPFIALLP